MQITIRIEGPVHVHTESTDDLRRIEAKIDRVIALARRILQASVTDPAEFDAEIAKLEQSTAQLDAVVKAVATPATP